MTSAKRSGHANREVATLVIQEEADDEWPAPPAAATPDCSRVLPGLNLGGTRSFADGDASVRQRPATRVCQETPPAPTWRSQARRAGIAQAAECALLCRHKVSKEVTPALAMQLRRAVPNSPFAERALRLLRRQGSLQLPRQGSPVRPLTARLYRFADVAARTTLAAAITFCCGCNWRPMLLMRWWRCWWPRRCRCTSRGA